MKAAVYTRPEGKPMRIPVTRRPEFTERAERDPLAIVAVDRATECHVTPPDVAARMVAYLGAQGDYLTLEPSAGTGNLVRALQAVGHSLSELVQIERHCSLAARLSGTVINRCFLEYAQEVRGRVQFPRVIMNPPFSEVRKHIAAALSLMGRGGHDRPAVLVALVPITFNHDRAEHLETLANDTFATAKVNTKIIRIYGE